MKTKIFENENLSPDFKKLIERILSFEISFDAEAISTRMSELFNNSVSQSDINHLEDLMQNYVESTIESYMKLIQKGIGYEESSGFNRRRIGDGDYHSRSKTNYNLAFLKLYKNIIDGIDEVLKDSEISFDGFTYHLSRHKKSLKAMLHNIRWADNKHEERGKTALYHSLEKQCFDFFLVLLLLKNLKTKNQD